MKLNPLTPAGKAVKALVVAGAWYAHQGDLDKTKEFLDRERALVEQLTNATERKANQARSILESRLGGVTRERGECLHLPDGEAISILEGWGWVWNGSYWVNQPLHDGIRAMERDLDIPAGSLPTRFIWGDD